MMRTRRRSLDPALHDMGATVRAYDPIGMEQAKKCRLS
jgi:hypothetical protein